MSMPRRLSQLISKGFHGDSFPYGLLVPTYLVSNLFSAFFLNASFWDDWQRPNSKIESGNLARLAGFPPWREFIEFDLLRNSTSLFHLTTPVLFFVAAIAIQKIFHSGLRLTNFKINLITAIFLLLPVNSARFSVICFFYTFCYSLFFVAWALAISRKSWVQFLSIPLFWLSFGHSSLLPFFLLPIIHLFYIKFVFHKRRNIPSFLSFGLTLLIPVSYWIVRSQTFGANVREYYVPKPLGVIRGSMIVAFAISFLAFGLLVKKWRLDTHIRSLLFGFGLLAIGLGAAAYMAAGHLVDISDWMIPFVPNFSDWDSRHQMLLPLGIALVIASAFANETDPPHQTRSLSIGITALLGICVVLNFTFSQEYYLDSLKQKEVISQFENLEAFDQGTEILINDESTRFNARGRFIRSYEWLGMLESLQKHQNNYELRTFGYVYCDDFQPTVLITIAADNGRLEALFTRNLGVRLVTESISPCG
jgi:hypothetical protein